MKKLFTVFATAILLGSTLFTSPAFADTGTPTSVSQQQVDTSKVYTDGFYVAGAFPLGVDQSLVDSNLLDLNLSLQDTTGKEIAKAVANKMNFGNSSFLVHFNLPSYKIGDKFRLQLDSANALIDHLDINQQTRIKVGQYANIEVVADADGGDSPIRVTGTKEAPVLAVAVLPQDKALLKTIDESGKPVGDVSVKVQDEANKTDKVLKTNSQGVALVDINAQSDKMVFSLENSNGLTLKNASNGTVESIVTHNGQLNVMNLTLVSDTGFGVGNVTVSTKSEYNSDLGTQWSNFSLQLKSGDQTQSLTGFHVGDVSVNAPSGLYGVKAIDNRFADVKLASNKLTVADSGKVNLTATVTPKYVLEVSKTGDGKSVPFKFSVINTQGDKQKVYEGTEAIKFAVAQGQTIMLKDNDTGKVISISIENSGVTKVDLSAGIVAGGNGSPVHTGDNIIYLGLGLLASILLLIFAVKKFNLKVNHNSTLSMLLVTALVASSLIGVAHPVYAGIGGGEGSAITGNLNTMTGQLQAYEGGMLRIFGVDTRKVNLSSTSTVTDLASNEKYNYSRFALYIAPDQTFQNRWVNGEYREVQPLVDGSVAWANAFDGANAYNRETNDFRINNRTLPVAGTDNSNPFHKALGEAIAGKNLKLDPYGESINEAFGIGKDVAKQQSILNGYLEDIRTRLLGKTPQVTQAAYDNHVQAANEGHLVLVFETVPGFYLNGGDREKGIFTTSHQYLLLNELIAYTPELDEYLGQEATVVNNSFISGCNGLYASNPDPNQVCADYNHIRFSGKKAMESYISTARPIVPGVAENNATNPFGGWGFADSNNTLLADSPGVYVTLECTEVDGSGKETGNTFEVSPQGYTEADAGSHPLKKMIVNNNSAVLSGPGAFVINGVKYYLVTDNHAPLEVVDKKDNEKLDSGTTSVSQKSWEVDMGLDTAKDPKDIGEYLSTDEMSPNNVFDASGNTKSKYFGKVKSDGAPDFSDAKIIIKVKVMNSKNVPDAEGKVPQWLLSKYQDGIFDTKDESYWQSSTSALNLTPDMDGAPSSLTPSGSVNFTLNVSDLTSQPWFSSNPKTIIPQDSIRQITHNNPSASIPVFGDWFAKKVNDVIDNVKTADWVTNNPSLETYGIGSTSQGEVSSREAVLTRATNVSYSIFNPLSYIHNIGKYRIESDSWTDAKGNTHTSSWRVNYTVPEVPTQSATPADYKLSIDFARYKPADTIAPTFEPIEVVKNGFASISAQSPTSLLVDPEVPMGYSDEYGNDGISFAAGDKSREIKPVSYNTLTYTANVKSNVVGTAVATDPNAMSLASRLGANGKPVLYKGSGVNISFDPVGVLTAKTFALDIGDTAHKNVWNPGITYTAANVDESFMQKFGKKDADGNWDFSGKATENLKITDKLFGKNVADVKFENTNNTRIDHSLTVRSGKLVAVDGDYNFKATLATSNPELLSALENMKLTTDGGVLSVFESEKGDLLSEQEFADLANAVRGTSDIATGKGWYFEDSTVLIVSEFTHTFKLPLAMFSDKVPMTVNSDLNSPVDKTKFFSKGVTGHTVLRYGLWSNQQSLNPYDTKTGSKEVFMQHDSSTADQFGSKTTDYIVGNVSVLDSTR